MNGEPVETEQSPSVGFGAGEASGERGRRRVWGAGQEGAEMCWLAWGRAERQYSPRRGQQPHRQDSCQSMGWGHILKARASGVPHRSGTDGVPGCA